MTMTQCIQTSRIRFWLGTLTIHRKRAYGVWGDYTANITIDKIMFLGEPAICKTQMKLAMDIPKTCKLKQEFLTWKFYAPKFTILHGLLIQNIFTTVLRLISIDLHFFCKTSVNVDN